MGEFLALLRRASGFTQQEVADRLNISNRTLSSWETDRTTPDILLLPAIADLYGVTVDELLRCERGTTSNNDRQISEEALRSQRKHRLGKYSAKCLLLSGLGSFGAILLALAFTFALYTSCPTWLFILLVVISACDILVCAAVLFYNQYNAKLAEGLVLKEDYTEEKGAYAIGLKNNTGKFFLFCALPLITFAVIILIVFFAVYPENYEIMGIVIDVKKLYYITIGVCGGLGIVFLIAYLVYANAGFNTLANEVQRTTHIGNAKLCAKCYGVSAIAVIATLILMIVFIYVTPKRAEITYFTANSVEEIKHNFQTLTVDRYDAGRYGLEAGDYYLNFNEDEKNKITFTDWRHNIMTLYDLGNGFYGNPDLFLHGWWEVLHLDDELPPEELGDYETVYNYFTHVGNYKEVYFYNPDYDDKYSSDFDKTVVNIVFEDLTNHTPEYDFAYKQECNLWYYNEEGVWRYELDVWYDYSLVFSILFVSVSSASVITATIIYLAKRKKQIYNL